MTQDLVQLGQRGLLFRLGDGIGGNDLILHERAQKHLSRRARRRGKNRSTATSQPYPYACGKARVRARGENVDGKGDGEAGQPGVDQSVSGQGRQPVRRVHEQDGLLVQEAGDHLLPWGWRMEDEKKVLRAATAVLWQRTYNQCSEHARGIFHSALPRTFPPCPHCSPTSPGRADAQTAASYGWQTGQSQFSCKGGNRMIN